jgi:hypothetical protein
MHMGFWWESQKERDHYEHVGGLDNIKMDLTDIG